MMRGQPSARSVGSAGASLRRRPLDTYWLSVRAGAVLAAFGLLVAIAADAETLLTPYARDFAAYYAAAVRLTHGAALFIPSVASGPPDSQSVLAWRYAPYLALLFVPFTALPFSLAAAVWATMHVIVGVWVVRVLPVPRGLKLALLIWTPFVTDVWVGNISTFMVGAFLVGWRWLPATGLVGAIKPYAALTLLELAASRAWRALGISVAIWLGVVALSLPIVGVQSYLDFFRSIVPTASASYADIGGGGLLEVAHQIGMPMAAAGVAFVVAGILTLAALRQAGPLRSALILLVSAAWSPIVHIHGWLLAMPAMAMMGNGMFWLLYVAYAADYRSLWWLVTTVVVAWVEWGRMRRARDAAVSSQVMLIDAGDAAVETAEP